MLASVKEENMVDANKIILAGTLDTKGEEILFLRNRLSDDGIVPIVIDIGTLGKPYFQPDVSGFPASLSC
jgi:uncharacterized protein (UPF0261 family)